MPLTSHGIEGHTREPQAFRVSMLNDDQVVLYQLSDAALDELAGLRGTESRARLTQYLFSATNNRTSRSRPFDAKPILRGSVVKIFLKHVGVKSGEITPIGLKLTFDGDN